MVVLGLTCQELGSYYLCTVLHAHLGYRHPFMLRTKTVHAFIALAVLAGVTSAQAGVTILIVFGSFWIAGLIEAFGSPDCSEIVRAAITQTIACLAGICAIVPIAIPSNSSNIDV